MDCCDHPERIPTITRPPKSQAEAKTTHGMISYMGFDIDVFAYMAGQEADLQVVMDEIITGIKLVRLLKEVK